MNNRLNLPDCEPLTRDMVDKLEEKLVEITEIKRKLESEKRAFNAAIAEQLKNINKKIYAISGAIKNDDVYILHADLGDDWENELNVK